VVVLELDSAVELELVEELDVELEADVCVELVWIRAVWRGMG
jgi:hypothetical protein